ncbi:hypothetical protein Tco_0462059 [Tanacetum coccineum]
MDFDFIPSHNDLGSDLDVSSPFGDRNKIYDPGICIEEESMRFLATLSPVIDTLLPFSSENDDKVFNHGVLASKEKSLLLHHIGASKLPSCFIIKARCLFQNRNNTPYLVFGHPIFIPLDKVKYRGNRDCPDFEAYRARGLCSFIHSGFNPQLQLRNPNIRHLIDVGKVRSKSRNKGIMPTEMELVLEQTQQGTSHELSLVGMEKVAVSSSLRPLKLKYTIEFRANKSSINLVRTLFQYTCFSHTVKTRNILRVLRIILVILPEHPSDTKVFTMKMEILLEPTSNKLMDYIKMEMQIPHSSRFKFMATCSYSRRYDFITSRKNDPKLLQTLISTSSVVCQSDEIMN